jgi:uncharacterized protein (DUF2249 family)
MTENYRYPIIDLSERTDLERNILVFQLFESMRPFSHFVFIVKEEPKTIYSQLENEHHGSFVWKYLEEGPQQWRVILTKVP